MKFFFVFLIAFAILFSCLASLEERSGTVDAIEGLCSEICELKKTPTKSCTDDCLIGVVLHILLKDGNDKSDSEEQLELEPTVTSSIIAEEVNSCGEGEVNIDGLNKVDLLHHLWKRSSNAAFNVARGIRYEFDEAKAANAVDKYIDYFQGRMIKSDLTHSCVNPWLYDRDTGAGSFASIAKQLKKE